MTKGAEPTPSQWVCRFAPGLRQGGRVLDVACGGGRHFPVVRAVGCSIHGIDRDLAAAKARWSDDAGVILEAADIEQGGPPPFRDARYQGVIVTNYLWRPLLPDIVAAVAPDGLLIYETFMRGNERFGRPSNPDFLLESQELLRACAGRLAVVAFEQVVLAAPDRVVQRIAAAGPDHPWAKAAGPA